MTPKQFIQADAASRCDLTHEDKTSERPIPTAWRETLREIADALSVRDYGLARGIAGVAPVSPEAASHMQKYVEDCGATLVALPEETWKTSVCIWNGDYWDALIDLWTREEGRSDLVLQVRVAEAGTSFSIEIHMVYVP